MFTHGNQAQISALRQLLGEHEAEMFIVLAKYGYHKPIIDSLKTMITTLGGDPTGLPPNTETPAKSESAAVETTSAPAQLTSATSIDSDRKLAKMPAKLPTFAAMTTIQAAEHALQHCGKKSLHVDELVFAIYGNVVGDQFRAAKRTLVSEMIRGTEKGSFRRTGKPNTFRLGTKTHINGTAGSVNGGSDGEDGRPDA